MRGIVYLSCSTVGGWVGWWLGGFGGLWGSYMLGVVGTALGVWLAHRLNARYIP